MKKKYNQNHVLLSISNVIVRIKDKEDMLQLIQTTLKQYVRFNDGQILRFNKTNRTCKPFIYRVNKEQAENKHLTNYLGQEYAVADDSIEDFLDPIVYDVASLIPSGSEQIHFMHNVGVKEFLVVKLIAGNELIGFLVMFSEQKDSFSKEDLDLVHRISFQIAISTANIIANEEISKREEEKSILFSLTSQIAAVKNKNELSELLNAQLNKLFAIADYVIYVLSDDKKTLRPILFNPNAGFAQNPDFIHLVDQQINVDEVISNNFLYSDDQLSFSEENWFHLNSPSVYTHVINHIGLTKMAGISLRMGNENIAVMYFSQDELFQPVLESTLFKSICSQLAITVANIMANEKVNMQLSEINKYKQQLEEEKLYLKEEIATNQNFSELIGESEEMKRVFRLVQQVSSSDSTVLLLGETGTGKELIARAIHNGSPRRNKLMIKVNCAAIPPSLIESELFGHERGSFTGANERRIGKFELAHQGTLFLDEIGEMPLEMQVKLLRALQEKEIERVGGRTTIKVDARIITATNRDLEKLMEGGKFRSDLYYRLNIFPIELPPLRNRKEDIPLLAMHFVKRFSKKAGKNVNSFSNKAIKELTQYNWPGNIRELEHLIERTVLLASSETIKEIQLPSSQKNLHGSKSVDEIPFKSIDENERDYILKVLKHVKGKISGEDGAAALLGIPPSTLHSRMKRLGIRKEHFV